eukprot:COSAG04_NODE_259_length_18733_cov_5.191371_8_plen_272_part_00
MSSLQKGIATALPWLFAGQHKLYCAASRANSGLRGSPAVPSCNVAHGFCFVFSSHHMGSRANFSHCRPPPPHLLDCVRLPPWVGFTDATYAVGGCSYLVRRASCLGGWVPPPLPAPPSLGLRGRARPARRRVTISPNLSSPNRRIDLRASAAHSRHFPGQKLRLGGDALGADPTYLLYLPSRSRGGLRRIDFAAWPRTATLPPQTSPRIIVEAGGAGAGAGRNGAGAGAGNGCGAAGGARGSSGWRRGSAAGTVNTRWCCERQRQVVARDT